MGVIIRGASVNRRIFHWNAYPKDQTCTTSSDDFLPSKDHRGVQSFTRNLRKGPHITIEYQDVYPLPIASVAHLYQSRVNIPSFPNPQSQRNPPPPIPRPFIPLRPHPRTRARSQHPNRTRLPQHPNLHPRHDPLPQPTKGVEQNRTSRTHSAALYAQKRHVQAHRSTHHSNRTDDD